MRRKLKSRSYKQNMADSFADAAKSAELRGERGRAVLLFEAALEFQLGALALAIDETAVDTHFLVALYIKAISFALGCGRLRKARQLSAQVTLLDASPEQTRELEMLNDKVASGAG